MTIEKLSIPVNFDLSFLKIRWSDHMLVKDGEAVVGEGVVYGGDWEKAERLARQMAEMKFGAKRGSLQMCEQIFIESAPAVRFPLPPPEARRRGGATAGFGCDSYFLFQQKIGLIRKRGSNLKVKVGRNVFQDIKTLEFIRRELKFPNEIRIDANQGYSLKQLQYLIPTLKQLGIVYVEEPVKVKDLSAAAELLHRYGLKIILDESLMSLRVIPTLRRKGVAISSGLLRRYSPRNDKGFIDAINIKLSRIGDINQALHLIKLAKKLHIKAIIGCSEELERGMEAIYALGAEAMERGVLLEVEGYGPLRLASYLRSPHRKIPRWVNKLENLLLVAVHRGEQLLFDCWWQVFRLWILMVKKTKLLSALSLRLVKLTGKYPARIHPKHLVSSPDGPEYLRYMSASDVVLDIGCGNGQHALKVANVAKQVVGFDTDPKQLEIAKQSAASARFLNLTFRRLSAGEKFRFASGTFTRVLFLGVLEHLVNRDLALSEAYRVLKPGGLLLLGVPNEMTSWKKLQWRFGIFHYTDPDHRIEYTTTGLISLLNRHHFEVIRVSETAFDTPWAGVIDVIGGLSLKIYRRLMVWKWSMVKRHPEESISFFVVAKK